MAAINEIKQRILQLDAGSFQAMCDRYLSKIGYPNIVSLGTQAGTNKTTRGTPDTYFFDSNGKYVFVEYTTQQSSVPEKIKSDIEKCLNVDATHVPHDKISEIIYCHTSSNIAPEHDNEFRTMCDNVGIKLSIYGIDQLAQDLYLKQRGIAKEYLHISFDTNQIETKDDFVRHYDESTLAAPLSTMFQFREEELGELDKLLEKTNVVILCGAAGTGKTRLALHYAETYAQEKGAQLLCIHDNALPIYDDLSLYLESPGRYVLLVDDANQLSGLQYVAHYAIRRADGYDVKIIITARDYAVNKVQNELESILPFETLTLALLSDEQIKQLIKTELGILNETYLNRIARLAEGNARIAMLAGKLAHDANRLDSINDITQLYAAYYNGILVDTGLDTNTKLLATAGIMSFLRTLHIDNAKLFAPILSECRLTKDEFVENLFSLHKLEVVDICNDKAVRFTEQCLSNYILKYVFCDKKLISIKSMVRICFERDKERTLNAINTLLNVYHVEELHDFIGDEMKSLWNELAEMNSPLFFEYVKSFFPVNLTETILLLQSIIEQEESVYIPIEELEIKKESHVYRDRNDVLNILGGFANTLDIDSALDLFFEYFRKRPDYYSDFYQTIKTHYSISRHSYSNNYYTQIRFLEKIIEHSANFTDEYVTELFLSIASSFLALSFTGSEASRGDSFTFYSFFLVLSEGVEKYRSLIWNSLHALCKQDKYHKRIYDILKKYGHTVDSSSTEVIKLDAPYVVSIMETAYPPDCLKNCLLAQRLSGLFSHVDDWPSNLFEPYIKHHKLSLHHLLLGPRYEPHLSHDKRNIMKRDAITKYVSSCSAADFFELIDICHECSQCDSDNTYELSTGMEWAFHAYEAHKENYISAVNYYFEKNTPLNVFPFPIVDHLFSIMSPSDILSLINARDFDQKDSWLYAYYHEIPTKMIDSLQLDGLYAFLQDRSDAALTNASYRDIDFLDKYSALDSNVYINGAKIIYSKTSYSPFVAHLYFSRLFNIYHQSPEVIINKFSNNLLLLEDIYIAMCAYSTHEDLDGKYLVAIYRVCPSILERYVKEVLCKEKHTSYRESRDKHLVFFDLNDYNYIYDTIIDELSLSSYYSIYGASDFVESIIIPKQNNEELWSKQDQWIRHYITSFYQDSDKMNLLFLAISHLSADHRITYINLFLGLNDEFEAFKSLPLFPLTTSWTNSAVPYLSKRIDYLKKLLPLFVGLKFVQHKKLIESRIDSIRAEIHNEEIRDILGG